MLKIVQLRGVPLEDRYEMIYGLDFQKSGIVMYKFADLSLANIKQKPICCTYMYEYQVLEEPNGFKHIYIYNGELNECEIGKEMKEDKLLVIIQYSVLIETTATKVAGRYSTEAILEMHDGDVVKLTKGENKETYMAVKAGNEMFLIKKNR